MVDLKLLRSMPKNAEPALVEKLYRDAIKESAWSVWPTVKSIKDEHVEILLRCLPEDRDLEPVMIRIGHEEDGADGVREAGAYLSYAYLSTNLPGLLKRLVKERAKFKKLLPVAALTVEALLDGEEPDVRPFWGLVFLLAAAKKSDALMAKVKIANDRWTDEYGVFDRVMKAAGVNVRAAIAVTRRRGS